MEVVRLAGYDLEDKLAIAREHLVPRALEEAGLADDAGVKFTDDALAALIKGHAREAGVRTLQKLVEKISRKLALRVVRSGDETAAATAPEAERGREGSVVSAETLADFVGKPRFSKDRLYDDELPAPPPRGRSRPPAGSPGKYPRGVAATRPRGELIAQVPPGVVMGLAWTSMGGAALYVEATKLSAPPASDDETKPAAPPRLSTTGQLGGVMEESTRPSGVRRVASFETATRPSALGLSASRPAAAPRSRPARRPWAHTIQRALFLSIVGGPPSDYPRRAPRRRRDPAPRRPSRSRPEDRPRPPRTSAKTVEPSRRLRRSTRVALNHVRAREAAAGASGLDGAELHVHVPDGATPKDGPSAGVTVATALLSLARGDPVRQDLAMTGELSLTGRVLPAGARAVKPSALAPVGRTPNLSDRTFRKTPAPHCASWTFGRHTGRRHQGESHRGEARGRRARAFAGRQPQRLRGIAGVSQEGHRGALRRDVRGRRGARVLVVRGGFRGDEGVKISL